ncbi:hypothetical protein GOBAR_AA33791 [Gossypium barbadense]|uniref:Uncharacterized protein n=1 Tax=Gossypium barbadense TaxID=3634 RepID=A0A2P5W717_GOSBA|nr:hypothetical protein GOBAR_AA33791 [Gossypium barbadense]
MMVLGTKSLCTRTIGGPRYEPSSRRLFTSSAKTLAYWVRADRKKAESPPFTGQQKNFDRTITITEVGYSNRQTCMKPAGVKNGFLDWSYRCGPYTKLKVRNYHFYRIETLPTLWKISYSERKTPKLHSVMENFDRRKIGQLAKLISERPQGKLPSNTESNPREQLNAITSQDEEGLVTPVPEPRQETETSKGKDELDHNEQKLVSSYFVWETKHSPFKPAILAPHQKLKEMSLKEAHEPFSSNTRGPIHEDRRL